MFDVVYHDNIGPHDFVQSFNYEDDAVRFAEDDAESLAEEWRKDGIQAKIWKYGQSVEVWESGGDRYAEYVFAW